MYVNLWWNSCITLWSMLIDQGVKIITSLSDDVFIKRYYCNENEEWYSFWNLTFWSDSSYHIWTCHIPICTFVWLAWQFLSMAFHSFIHIHCSIRLRRRNHRQKWSRKMFPSITNWPKKISNIAWKSRAMIAVLLRCDFDHLSNIAWFRFPNMILTRLKQCQLKQIHSLQSFSETTRQAKFSWSIITSWSSL